MGLSKIIINSTGMNKPTSILIKFWNTYSLRYSIYTNFLDIVLFLTKKHDSIFWQQIRSNLWFTYKPQIFKKTNAIASDKRITDLWLSVGDQENSEFLTENKSNIFALSNPKRYAKSEKNKNKQTLFIFLNFLFFYSIFKSRHAPHHHLNFFYSCEFKKDLIIVNTKQFYSRWKDANDFIFNIYYYNFLPLLFGSFEFQDEVLALNWNNNHLDFNYWKYSHSFFTYISGNYGVRTKHFFRKIEECGVDFFLVTNVNYHYKNVFYFNKFRFFTIGPVTSNLSPWLLSYSLPVFSINPLSEYFFIKLIILLEKNSTFYKFYLKKSLWTFFFLKNINFYNFLIK